MLDYYKELLGYHDIPDFLVKYLETPCLTRLKNVGYFCGMDYASKDIYDFSEYISRYDHSLTTSLLTYKLTKNKEMTLAALFHDVATPCFSHVIDYMNKDYSKQESTEEYTEKIMKNDQYLIKCLEEDGIKIEDLDFKKYSIVDNDRPKLCVDRIDGVVLTGIGWTKDIKKEDIKNIVDDICLYKNEYNEDEIGFKNIEVAERVVEVSENINNYCHSKEDNFMMELLAKITKTSIKRGYITYEDLYKYTEKDILNILNIVSDVELIVLMNIFENISKKNIPNIELEEVKQRKIKPIVNYKRI